MTPRWRISYRRTLSAIVWRSADVRLKNLRSGSFLKQRLNLAVDRYGHCNFTAGEAVFSFAMMLVYAGDAELLPGFADLLTTEEMADLEAAAAAGWRRVWWARTDPALASLRSSLDAPLAEHLDFVLSEPFPAGIPRDNETDRLALRECILRLQEHLLKRQHLMIETTLERERTEQGADAELATLEKAGVVDSNERLRQVFLQKEQKQHLK